MSKKQIIKNIQNDKKESKGLEEKDNYFKFITTLTLLLIVFVLSYFLIGVFYTKEISFDKNEEETNEVSVDNNTIMLGQLFDQTDSEYYVIVYDLTDKTSSIPSWVSVFKNNNDISVYTVDSSKKFNSSYIVKESSNKNASGLDDLKVISPTLIKISNKSITEYIEGEDNIVNVLKGN